VDNSKKLKSFIKSMATLGSDLVKGEKVKVSDEVFTKRMSICEGCPELNKTTKQCNSCGCFVRVKGRLKKEACPLNKWTQDLTEDQE